MSQPLIFATNNAHKVEEVRLILGDRFHIQTLREAGIDQDIPEPHDTLQANAAEKAETIFRLTRQACFSEDTGLEVNALGGAPGVHSARYAGEGRDFDANIDKLLDVLRNQTDRTAQFRTVICLIESDGKAHFFEGICSGQIQLQRTGGAGFGYDPVFVPDGDTRSFAEMTGEEKNQFSHRRKAMDQLIAFLKND